MRGEGASLVSLTGEGEGSWRHKSAQSRLLSAPAQAGGWWAPVVKADGESGDAPRDWQ